MLFRSSKLETRSEVCYFIGYPKVTYGWYFYDSREQKLFVSINTIFLEDNYIMNRKPKGRIDLEEVMGEPSDSPAVNSNTEQGNTMTLHSSALVPHRSWRIIREHNRFMFLGEAFEAVFDNLESNPTSYEEAMADNDSSHWVKAMRKPSRL